MYNDEITIFRSGTVLYTVPLDDNAVYVRKLMGEHTVTMELRRTEPMALLPGDYIEWKGVRFALDEEPDYDNEKGVYVYHLTFYAYRLLNHIIYQDEGSMTFPYVGSAVEHLAALLLSIQAVDPEWQLGVIEGKGTQSLNFDNVYCIDALTQICQAFGLEWHIEGKTIHAVERVGTDTPHAFAVGQGHGLYMLEVKSVTNQKVTTRLYGHGAAINLPPDYRMNDIPRPETLVFDGRYLESNIDRYGVREDIVVFDDIFPRLKDATLTGVTIPVDPTVAIDWTVRVSLPFDLNHHLADEKAQIKFIGGALTGEAFIVTSYNHATGELKFSASDDNGYILPSATRQPQVGDAYVLLNILMPEAYITAAEEELQQATAKELVKRHNKARAYTLEIDPRHVCRNKIEVAPGDSVQVADLRSGLNASVRIAEVSYTLQNPERLSLVLSDTPLYTSYADKIEADINNVVQGVNQVTNKTETTLSFWDRAFEIRNIEGIPAIVAKLHLLGLKTISQLYEGTNVPGGGSGGGGGTLYHDRLEHLDYPNQHPIAAVTGLQSALNAKLNASAISAWALEPQKPAYAFRELTDKPTTLAGYGITDAMTASAINAALAGKADTSALTGYLPLAGGNITGNLTIAGHQVWHSGNSNRREADWTAKKLYAANGLHVDASDAGDYTEGIRIANTSNGGCHLFLGCQRGAVSGAIDGQWSITKGNDNKLHIIHKGTAIAMTIEQDKTVILHGNVIVKGKITQLG